MYDISALQISASPAEVPFESWETLPDRALLAIRWRMEGGRPYWHWVVFARQGDRAFVLDSKKSLKSNVRYDFGRMTPKWYIEVHS